MSERKIEVSGLLARQLVDAGAPLLAAYWEWREERGGWVLFLVSNEAEERRLVGLASSLLVNEPHRSVFSLADVIVDSHQIERARALASYVRGDVSAGRRIDTTFTGGHYFEIAMPVYVAPELASRQSAARVN